MLLVVLFATSTRLPSAGARGRHGRDHVRPDGTDQADEVAGDLVAAPFLERLVDAEREAEVDGADIDGLEQRRTELEIDPLDLDAERLEGVLDRAALPHSRKEPALLRADADFDRLVLCLRMGGRHRERCENQRAGDDISSRGHAFFLSDLIKPSVHNGECVLVCLPPSTAFAARSASRAERKSRPSRRSKARSAEKKVNPRSSPATIPAVRL
jgi:hypothetical protein